jgi:hypothetical protein
MDALLPRGLLFRLERRSLRGLASQIFKLPCQTPFGATVSPPQEGPYPLSPVFLTGFMSVPSCTPLALHVLSCPPPVRYTGTLTCIHVTCIMIDYVLSQRICIYLRIMEALPIHLRWRGRRLELIHYCPFNSTASFLISQFLLLRS